MFRLDTHSSTPCKAPYSIFFMSIVLLSFLLLDHFEALFGFNKNKPVLSIVYWSDFACPFCYIGEKRLEHVLEEMDLLGKTEFIFKSFELDPYAPREPKYRLEYAFSEHYRMSLSDARRRIEAISQLGRNEGIDFRLATVQSTTTLDAHRVFKMVESRDKDKAEEIVQLFYDAYFTKNLKLTNRTVLAEVAQHAGITREELDDMLSGKEYIDAVRADETEARKRGVTSVPYFVLNGKQTLSGAQSRENMKWAITQALKN